MRMWNLRERLENMAKAPSMYAVTREGFLCQVMLTMALMGVDSRPLERIGVSPTVPRSLVDVEHLLTRIQSPLDPWTSTLIEAALAMLPEGPAIYSITNIGS